jgi:hypothetical protein
MFNNVLLTIYIAIALNFLCLSGWLIVVYRQHQYLKSIKGKTVLTVDRYGTFTLEVSENGTTFIPQHGGCGGGGIGSNKKIDIRGGLGGSY